MVSRSRDHRENGDLHVARPPKGRVVRPRTRVSTAGAHDPVDQETTARTSRAERMRYSSPPYFTSVPPYLL